MIRGINNTDMKPFISKRNRDTLIIDFDEYLVTVEHRGTYNKEPIYSWSIIEPTEGTLPNYESKIIREVDLKEKLGWITGDLISSEDRLSIDLFLNRKTDGSI
jgi:hypothetical protein